MVTPSSPSDDFEDEIFYRAGTFAALKILK
jgi:hypothetical protein